MKSIYTNLSSEMKLHFSKIKLLALDFDGTLTDNKVYTAQDSTETVMADRGDGLGLEILRQVCDTKIIILSKEPNPVTAARARKLNIPCIHGIENKIEIFIKEIAKCGISSEETCFAGNDFNDIECIKHAGLGVAVADSYYQVLKAADYITEKKGGHGAVREICEIIMYAKGVHPFP